MNDEDSERSGDARQLRTTEDFGVIHVEAHRQAASGDGLTKTVQERVQSLIGVKLGMGDEAAGVIQGGVEEGLPLASARALDVGAVEHVRLPDLVGMLGFELFVSRRCEQLTLGEAALLEEAIKGGGGEGGLVLAGDESEFPQQGGAGAMGIFAFEALDQVSELGRNGARLPAVLARLGSQGFKAAGPIAERPVEQGIDGH